MKTIRVFTLMVLAPLLAVAGCATTDSSVPAGTGLGAAAGALLGYGLTGKATGAAAGAGAGALAGAIGGAVVDTTKKSGTQPPPSQPAPAQSYQAPPPHSQPAPQAYATQPDPTKGEFFNNTGWRVEIYVDDAKDPVHLSPRQSYGANLDIGNHQIVAKAYVNTQFGERLVGRYNRSIRIDPKGSGWSLRFDENMF